MLSASVAAGSPHDAAGSTGPGPVNSGGGPSPAIRPLLIAEQCDPAAVSVPLIGWSHSRAIAELPGVRAHLVTQVRNRERLIDAGAEPRDFTAIDSEAVARPLWRLENLLRGGAGKGWTTVMALRSVSYAHFERVVWRGFGPALRRGEYDIVHRITPLSPTVAGCLARLCRGLDVPFVLGPLNGGVSWPPGFGATRRREREWLSYVRGAYRLNPFHRSLRSSATAIIVGSLETLRQEDPRHREKCVYIPENAVDPGVFARSGAERLPAPPLRVAFVGRLVPYKGADILVEAAAPLVRDGAVVLDIIGDGPDAGRVDDAIEREGIEACVERPGWVPHGALGARLARAHVLGFPSIREFGGGVVLEAMALGVVPIVMDYGGPGELVTSDTGYKVPIGRRAEIVAELRRVLGILVARPRELAALGARAVDRVVQKFTWTAKASQIVEVYRWVLGHRRDRPDFGFEQPTG